MTEAIRLGHLVFIDVLYKATGSSVSRNARNIVGFLVIAVLIAVPLVSVYAFFGKRDLRVEPMQPKRDPFVVAVEGVIAERASKFEHGASVYMEALSDDTKKFQVAYDADRSIPAASVIKLPIMAACYLLSSEGKFDLQGTYALSNADRTEGSGVLKAGKAGSRYSHMDLIKLMMQKSDNTATNALIRLIGMDVLNDCFSRMGLTGTSISAKVLDRSAMKKGVENYVTAKDCAKVMREIHEKQFVSPEASAEMLEIMLHQKVRNRIPRLLPKGTPVANKTGTVFNYFHDVGIVFSDRGDFIVCVLTHGQFTDYNPSKDFISDVARLAYDYYIAYAGMVRGITADEVRTAKATKKKA
jgi:beta-lactamase class A